MSAAALAMSNEGEDQKEKTEKTARDQAELVKVQKDASNSTADGVEDPEGRRQDCLCPPRRACGRSEIGQ